MTNINLIILVHQSCLLIDEPVTKLRQNENQWLCRKCRPKVCCKCLKDKTELVSF